MEASVLISGLIGALLSAALSYWVRAALAKRAQREAEQRVAYVNFVRVSELVATETVITGMLKLMVGDQAAKSYGAPNGSFESSHKASVIFAEQIRQFTPEKLKETSGMAIVPHLLKGLLDNVNESQLSTDLLSKLPKETVLTYSFFLNDLNQLRLIYQLWIDFFETADHSWVTPESIHGHMLAIARFYEQAKKLRFSLIQGGAATPAEASAVLKKQIETYTELIFSNWSQQQKLKAAMTATRETVASQRSNPATI